MSVLVTYQSKTGFTKKYAEWISQELSCDIKEISEITTSDIAEHRIIIHGGWIMAGKIKGLDIVRKLQPQRLIVFGVGFTPKEKADIAAFVDANTLGDTPFFYYEGGIDPQKMGFMGRTMVKMLTKKAPEYTDNTNKAAVGELLTLAKAYASEL